jgi:hypothetical protein
MIIKILFSILFLLSTTFAEDKAAAGQPLGACGSEAVRFDVSTRSSQEPLPQPEAGKALLYFLQDEAGFLSRPRPTTRLGIDGNWVGASHANSYFYVAIEPGEHHLCANWQNIVTLFDGRKTAVAHFTAEAGKNYYFRAQNFWSEDSRARMEFGPLDSDEARLLMSQFSLSASHQK